MHININVCKHSIELVYMIFSFCIDGYISWEHAKNSLNYFFSLVLFKLLVSKPVEQKLWAGCSSAALQQRGHVHIQGSVLHSGSALGAGWGQQLRNLLVVVAVAKFRSCCTHPTASGWISSWLQHEMAVGQPDTCAARTSQGKSTREPFSGAAHG